MDSITSQTFHYDKGVCFSINKLSYDWTALEKFSSLKTLFQTKKHLRNPLPSFGTKPEFYYNNEIETPFQDNNKNLHMSICLPCYDEEWSEISGTIRSISKNILFHHKNKNSSFAIHISLFIIQDGWTKASSSFKEGIVAEFGCPSQLLIDKTLLGSNCTSIFIPDGELFYPASSANKDTEEIEGIFLFPIFITKFSNSQKFNSHLIFFSLCNLQKPDFVFLTDCGTIYNEDCIYELLEYLYKKHQKIIGVTAKQKVMNQWTRQQILQYPSWWSSRKNRNLLFLLFDEICWWMSPAPLQGFEFESSFLLNTSMFTVVKLLPVLPGPCQMIWWPHLDKQTNPNNSILNSYFKHLNMDINGENIIRANTILAEDRLLSFSLILKSQNLKTIWVKSATFSYEPMTSWVKLLGQRRRWINGTISTFLYYLVDKKGVDEIHNSALNTNGIIKFFWIIQLYQSILQILSPSFFCMAIYESTESFLIKFPRFRHFIPKFHIPKIQLTDELMISLFYFCFYILWILFSMICGKCPKNFNKKVYNIIIEFIYIGIAFINQIVSIFLFYNIIMFNKSTSLVFLLAIMWIIPFIMSLLLSVSSVTNYIMYSIPFFSNIIQYVCFIPTYSFARIHDLSWGNRESFMLVEKESHIWTTIQLNLLSVILNLGLLIGYVFVIDKFGRNEYLYLGIYFFLFFSIFLQIIMTICYFAKVTCLDCKKV
jgi:cellulose synthase/poly-beta-1,6-N-acetylglucosamine synthase-like glycosyltransferase